MAQIMKVGRKKAVTWERLIYGGLPSPGHFSCF